MRQRNDKVRQCQFAAGADALPGDRRSSPALARRGNRTAVLLAISILMPANAANAGPGTGPTSSGTVEISISVAPRYKLLAEEASGAGAIQEGQSGRVCLTTNSSALSLPVMLVRPFRRRPEPSKAEPGHDWPADGSATEIRSCGPGQDHSAPLDLDPMERSASQLVLVRPD